MRGVLLVLVCTATVCLAEDEEKYHAALRVNRAATGQPAMIRKFPQVFAAPTLNSISDPAMAPALSMVPWHGQSASANPENVFMSAPFNGGGYAIPGMFGGSGGLGWGIGGAGVAPGYIDAASYGMPSDYLLPKASPQYWQENQANYQTPMYQGQNIFQMGGLRGMRGRSLSRFRAANPFNDFHETLLNPLNHPNWFYPNAMDPHIAPDYAPASATQPSYRNDS